MNSRACLDISHPAPVATILRGKMAGLRGAMGFHLDGLTFVVIGRDLLEVRLSASGSLPKALGELVTTYICDGRVASQNNLIGEYVSGRAVAKIRRAPDSGVYYVEVAAPTLAAAEELYREVARGNSGLYRK